MKAKILPKEEKGITLIALVITVIVLLILAGVTIATLTGDNGILKKTNEAEFKNQISTYKEELRISIYSDTTEKLGERNYKFNAKGYDEVRKLIPSFQKKDENILEVKEDKLIYIGKNKNEYRMAVDMDLISDDELIDDEIIEELQPFITAWTVEDGDSITLPITTYAHNRYNFTVDYGDGTGEFKITSATDENVTHTYEKAGTYTVTIKGKCATFSFNAVRTSKDKITKIVQWGSVIDNNGGLIFGVNLNFANCTNLTGPLPEPSKNSFKNVPNMSQLFAGCKSLNCEIPEKLLYGCYNVMRMDYIFAGSSIIGKIPNTLFKDCEKVISMQEGFRDCKGLTGSIPEDLFANCSNLETISYGGGFFTNCTGLTGQIPGKLFANCPKITSFNKVFRGCSGITGSIPENLFENNINATDFSYIFYDCKSLTGEIPEGLFKNNTKMINCSTTFAGCENLTGSIPENLFKNCPEITTFAAYDEGVFSRCKGLTGEIPENLFKNNTKVNRFTGVFYLCTGLTGDIPEKLFINNINATDFSNTFKGCSGLNGNIPENLFENNDKITNMSYCFFDCKNLKGNAPALWQRDTITNYYCCFSYCKKLSNYNQIPKSWGGGGT